MALIRMDAIGTKVRQHGAGPLPQEALSTPGPLVVMVHGYRFDPAQTRHCPHQHIFASHDAHPSYKARSWPRGLGIDCAGPRQLYGQIGGQRHGLAFGWGARGSIWQAHEEAARAGLALTGLLRTIHEHDPQREIHAIGHSLGARVILSALPALAPGTLGRVLLLAAAEYASAAEAALDSPAGRAARCLHVTSAENRVYDRMLGSVMPPAAPGDMVLGLARLPGLPTLRLDAPEHLAGLLAMGYDIAPPQRRVCHWSSYLRPGVFDLYRDLTGRGGAALHAEVTGLTLHECTFTPPRSWSIPLPWGANAS